MFYSVDKISFHACIVETLSQKNGFCQAYTYWDDHVFLFFHSFIITIIKLQMKLILYPGGGSQLLILYQLLGVWYICVY